MKQIIHIFGNSHVSQFSGQNTIISETEIYRNETQNCIYNLKRLGPCSAYNFFWNPLYFQNVLNYLPNINKETDYISLILGEIDCRIHIGKQSTHKNLDIDVVIDEVVDRLFINNIHLKKLGYNVIVFSVHPGSRYPPSDKIDSPVFGDYVYRNTITRKFNNKLKYKCQIHNIIFIDYFEELMIDTDTPNMDYFMDYVHIKSHMILPIIEQKILEQC